MAKDQKPETVKTEVKPEDKAITLIESFEKGDLINPQLDIMEGVLQLTIPVVKFEKDGQTLIGLYVNSTECPSNLVGPSDYFYFHTIKMSNNMDVGFCGSKALDDVLLKLTPLRYVVYIKYLAEKKVKQGKFKQFQIMAVDMENKRNPLYRLKDHPFVRVYENLIIKADNNTEGAGEERGSDNNY